MQESKKGLFSCRCEWERSSWEDSEMMRDELYSVATHGRTFGLCPPLFQPSSFALQKPVTIKNKDVGRL